MGRIYNLPVVDIADGGAAADLLSIVAPTNIVVLLHEVKITQLDSETSLQLPFSLHRTAAVGAGGTTVTPTRVNPGDAASTCTVKKLHSARATPGDILESECVNALAGIHWVWTPELRPVLGGTDIVIIGLEAAATLTWRLTVKIEEIG